MLRITTCHDRSRTVFELEGSLTGPWVEELKDCWQRAVSCGERVTAVVVPADPAEPPGLELLRTHVRARLPRYACPSEVVLTEAIPVLPSGKPDLAALKGGKNVTPMGTIPGAER